MIYSRLWLMKLAITWEWNMTFTLQKVRVNWTWMVRLYGVVNVLTGIGMEAC